MAFSVEWNTVVKIDCELVEGYSRYEELILLFFGQGHAERRRTSAHIRHHIEYFTLDYPNQLSLGCFF